MKALGTSTSDHSTHTLSSAVIEAVLRATALLALMGIAIIHLVQLVPTFEQAPLLGGAFVALIAGTLVVGAQLVNPKLSHTRLWLPVLALGAASIGGYVFTRMVSTPIDNQDVGNWACMLGLAALFVEGALVALSAYAISVASQRRSVRKGVPALSSIPQPASGLSRVGQVNGSGKLIGDRTSQARTHRHLSNRNFLFSRVARCRPASDRPQPDQAVPALPMAHGAAHLGVSCRLRLVEIYAGARNKPCKMRMPNECRSVVLAVR